MGGEKFVRSGLAISTPGSPLRRRGKVKKTPMRHPEPRITPARAGKGVLPPVCGCLTWDHPRMGGEKQDNGSGVLEVTGSPPRRRGKVLGVELHAPANGITPAQAGKR